MKQTMQKSRLMKTVMAIVLIAMVFSALPTLAAREDENFILDGSFEIAPKTNWYLGNTAYGDVEIMTDGETNGPADGGTNYMALERKPDEKNRTPYINQNISNPAAGTYKLSLWYKCPGTEATGTAAYYKLTISEKRKDDENSTTLETKQASLEGTNDVWTKAEIDITLNWTEESTDRRVSLNLYGYKVGEIVCYDLVSFEPFVPPLIKNGGFDTALTTIYADRNTNWYSSSKNSAKAVTSGDESYLSVTGSTGMYAQQLIELPAGTRIKLTFKFKTDTAETKPYVSIRAFPEACGKADYSSTLVSGKTDEWTTYTIFAQYNSNTENQMTGYHIYLRGTKAEVTNYYDDVSVEIANQVFFADTGKTTEATSFAAGDTLTASWNRISALEGGSEGQEDLLLIAALYETKNGVKRIVSIAPVVKDALGAPDTQGTDGTFYIAKVKELTTDLVIPETLDPDATYTAKMMCLSGTTLIPYEKTWEIYN